MTQWFRSLPGYRQKIYLLLVIAILLTLPCYCIGIVLLILAPDATPPASPAAPVPGESHRLDAPGAGPSVLLTAGPAGRWRAEGTC